MSGKQKKLAKASNPALAIDRPFDPAILKRAKSLAAQYRIVLEPDADLGFFGRSLEMPHVCGDGRTPDACVKQTREAIVATAATMLEMGQTPPAPFSDRRRDEQINIRVTPEEKFLLEEAAKSNGFRGISDFVRNTTLATLR